MIKMRVKHTVLHTLSNIPHLQESETTIKFAKRINDLFDALSRKTLFEGVRMGSCDLEVNESYNL